MSSDPDAPEIQEVFPESEKSSNKTGPSHFTLVPVDGDVSEVTAPSVELKSASPDRIQTIEQSITRQERLFMHNTVVLISTYIYMGPKNFQTVLN